MKTYLHLILSAAICLLLPYLAHSQNPAMRLMPNPDMAPFYHGVASGDPLPDRVIIWTRVTVPDPSASVDWRMATDTGMTNVVQTGSATTDATRDFTVKVDVVGLQPNTTYYYDFTHDGCHTIMGRTKTLPTGDVDSMRFAIVSCSNMGHGYFNAYNRITARNDIDAVIHLGDYIYEYGDGEFGSVRNLVPANEILTLNDYRMRHADYKLDADLRNLHQQYPFITVWDDHETANDSWTGGAANHTEGTEGLFVNRRSYSTQAYYEWMPIRQPDAAEPQRIYRQFKVGNLIDLHMLDTRLEGRDEQTAYGATINTSPTRELMGVPQFNWFCHNLQTSTAQWQIIGNQVMMAPLKALGQVLNPDQWDGYPAERQRLYDTLVQHNIKNFVVLTGDIHTSWANDLPLGNYNANNQTGSVGVEFVITSVTSTGFPISVPNIVISSSNPHNKYFELTKHGYGILDVNKQRVQNEWYFVDKVDAPSTTETFAAARYCNNNSKFLQTAAAPALPNPSKYAIKAPFNTCFHTNTTGLYTNALLALDVYPNPLTADMLTVRYYVREPQNITFQLTDMQGRILVSQLIGRQDMGLKYEKVAIPALPSGGYIINIVSEKGSLTKQVGKL